MGRRMPDFVGTFKQRAAEATALVEGIELVRAHLTSFPKLRSELGVHRIEYVYELAYLRTFGYWESFLEDSLIRYLCGYECSSGSEKPVVAFEKSLNAAEKQLAGSKSYLLWHNPNEVISRAKKYLTSSKHELVLSSNLSRLEYFARVRHRIAHRNKDARTKFEGSCIALCGKRFRGARAGAFLRDWNSASPKPERWFTVITNELTNLAEQLVP